MNNKKRVIENFIEGKGATIEEILASIQIELDVDSAVFLYTSHLEGLGNINSDIDVYVITSYEPKLNVYRTNLDCFGVEIKNINGLSFDIEYWSFEKINEYIDKLTNKEVLTFDYGILKILLRLHLSFVAQGHELGEKLKDRLHKLNLEKLIYEQYALEARSEYDDALKMYKSREFILSLDCCRRALWFAIAATNANNRKPNLKNKWISKIFLENKGFGNNDIYERYIQYQIFSNVNKDNLENTVEDMLVLIQDILTYNTITN